MDYDDYGAIVQILHVNRFHATPCKRKNSTYFFLNIILKQHMCFKGNMDDFLKIRMSV